MDTKRLRQYMSYPNDFSVITEKIFKDLITDYDKLQADVKQTDIYLDEARTKIKQFGEQNRWTTVDDVPENFKWEDFYVTLDNCGDRPKIMKAQEFWLDEGSEVEFFINRPITLPTGKDK